MSLTIAAMGMKPQSRDEVFASFGSGLACAVCNEPIEPNQVEYEVKCRVADRTETLRMHFQCFMAWRRASRSA